MLAIIIVLVPPAVGTACTAALGSPHELPCRCVPSGVSLTQRFMRGRGPAAGRTGAPSAASRPADRQ